MAEISQDAHDVTLNQIKAEAAQNSQTASDYINEQLSLEADAKEILPYKFDSCTHVLGPQRQSVYACLTCNPPPASPAQVYTPAGVCYGCSISCHGDHDLVELFTRRYFVCDCGTTRTPSTPCTLRSDPATGNKGVSLQKAALTNTYNHNFLNKFCGCGQEYDAETEKGTMYQCLGLGTVETGGCGEDWWHPHCLMGLPPDWPKEHLADSKQVHENENGSVGDHDQNEAPVPPGFPEDGDFDVLLCYKCVKSHPWIRAYAGAEHFLPPLFYNSAVEAASSPDTTTEQRSLKRKASGELSDSVDERAASPSKRLKEQDNNDIPLATAARNTVSSETRHKHELLAEPPSGEFSLLMKKDFREALCHCPACFTNLVPHPQLVEEEDEYQPSISDSQQSVVGGGSGTRSHGTGSLLERGEAALNNVDRVRAIEGVMVYNHLKDKVKEFLKPYAESGQAVGAEDIKAYFEKLRGDEAAIQEAGRRPDVEGDADGDGSDNRKEQSGY